MEFISPSPIFHSFLILSISPFSHINVQHGGVLCNFLRELIRIWAGEGARLKGIATTIRK